MRTCALLSYIEPSLATSSNTLGIIQWFDYLHVLDIYEVKIPPLFVTLFLQTSFHHVFSVFLFTLLLLLVADTRLYNLPCRSVRPSVRPKLF